MFHIALTPEHSPSNALSAQHETLMGAIADLLNSINLAYGPEEWYVSLVLVTISEAIENMQNNKTAKSSWTDMGCEDDAFSIDIFTHEEAKYVRHDGHLWLAPHGAVGFVADPLHEQWLYDQAEIGDWDNVLIPQAVYAAGPKSPISTNQMKDIIANADHMQLMVVRRQYADIHTALVDDGFEVDLQTVMVVVDQMASQDWFFVQLAKDLATAK